MSKSKTSLWNLSAWALKDVILASLLGMFFAVISFAVVHFVVFVVTPLATPFGVGELMIEIVFGIFFMSAVMAPYIIQKPGVAVVVGTLTGFLQILMGSAFASTVLLSAFVQGVGAEVAFATFRYKKYSWTTMLLAATGATIASFILAWYRGVWNEVVPGFIVLRFVMRLASACLISGVLAKFLADRLARAGVLKSYPLGGEISGPGRQKYKF